MKRTYGSQTFYTRYGKRIMDVFLSVCALIILLPVLLVTALLVRINLGSPALFRQERVGKNEKTFTLYKFRSMTDTRDENGELLPDKVRLTKFGKFLRSTSLDELPELWNILKGDMSIVGPRPLLVRYLPYYTEEEHHRHDVWPGLTGLAQVQGRNFLTWEEVFSADIEYVHNISFMEDLKIIFQTIMKVVERTDIEDLSAEEISEDGQLQAWDGEKMRNVHDSLDIERAEMYAAGNRQ